MQSKLIIFAGPSGAGKTSIVHALLEKFPLLSFSISATTRPKRSTEAHGKDYYFLPKEEFKQRVQNGEFIEWEEVYEGTYYGTMKSEVERISRLGRHVIFDVDVVGGMNIKKIYDGRALSVFIMPPSVEIIRARLAARNTETPETLERRVAKATHELTFAPQFDHTILNDNLPQAQAQAISLVSAFLNEK